MFIPTRQEFRKGKQDSLHRRRVIIIIIFFFFLYFAEVYDRHIFVGFEEQSVSGQREERRGVKRK
jgi:hypothetical protein